MTCPVNCPHCSSDQTQRLSAVFEAGTSVVESKLSGGGVALTPGGLAPVLASGSSTGVQQTALASKAAPPERQPVGQFLIFALLGSPFLAVLACLATIVVLALVGASPSGVAESLPEVVAIGTCVLLTALGLVGVVVGYRFNRDEWPGLYSAWQARWFCHRCGETFEPSEHRAAA